MDIGTIAGVLIAAIGIVLSIIAGGGDFGALVNVPSVFVVIGGTAGAVICSFPLANVLKTHSVVMKSILGTQEDPANVIRDMVKYAEVARREGILSLENLINDMKDPFIIRGVKMAVDGTDPELIKTIMDTELESLMDRHAMGKRMLDTISKYAPAFGMIGTLMGLIFMLSNMDDPSKIGPGMAVALVTTLYGALIANVISNPLADKLASKDTEEVLIKTIIIAGVMAIQSGDNPRVVESKLMTFLPPSRRAGVETAA